MSKLISYTARKLHSIFIILVLSEETEIIQPFLLGCDTKSLRVVQISLTALQRLISHQAISEVSDFTLLITVIRRDS